MCRPRPAPFSGAPSSVSVLSVQYDSLGDGYVWRFDTTIVGYTDPPIGIRINAANADSTIGITLNTIETSVGAGTGVGSTWDLHAPISHLTFAGGLVLTLPQSGIVT